MDEPVAVLPVANSAADTVDGALEGLKLPPESLRPKVDKVDTQAAIAAFETALTKMAPDPNTLIATRSIPEAIAAVEEALQRPATSLATEDSERSWFGFSITPDPIFDGVKSPRFDTLWSPGHEVNVAWTGRNLNPYRVSLELWKASPLLTDLKVGTIAAGVAAGAGEWTGPLKLSDGGTIPDGELYYVVIRVDEKPVIFTCGTYFGCIGHAK